jgi:hypothetical protein
MWVLRNKIVFGVAALLILVQGAASAASLNPETLKAWDAYVQAANDRMQQRLQPGQHFLWTDEEEDRLASVRGGEPYIAPVGAQNPKKVPFGLIHDWVGAVFIPDTRIEDVLLTMRDYRRYKEFYHPGVVASKQLESEGFKDKFSVVLMNRVLVAKKALDSDCESSYFRVDERHWYSISRTTRIQEVQNYGEDNQHELPQDVGTGLIWRLSSIARFEERDGGVYVELEAIALSRDIPASLHWIVAPIVRRASKSSLALSLEQTEHAIHPASESARLPADADLFDRGFRVLTK